MKKQLLTIGLATILGTIVISCGSDNNEAEEEKIILATEEVSADEREPFDALEAEDPIELDDDIDDYEETSSSNDWDSVLDDYEEYVDSYIRLFKKAQNGDLSAMSEYASMLDKANSLSNKLEKAEDSMTSKQLARYEKITLKMASVATY